MHIQLSIMIIITE